MTVQTTSYWPCALGDVERLVDHQAQRRTGEIDFLVAAVDGDLAGAGLQPDAGDRVLAAAGGVGAALRVELLLAQRRGRRRCGPAAARRLAGFGAGAGAGGRLPRAVRSARSESD